jgi:hypothetical protein
MENRAMFSAFDPKHPKAHEQYRRLAVPMLDQQIKSVINMIWMALPPERQTATEVEKEFQRLTRRALANMEEDIAAFGLPANPDET